MRHDREKFPEDACYRAGSRSPRGADTIDAVIEFPPPTPGEALRVSATLFVTYRRCPAEALARLDGHYPAETADAFVGVLAHRVFRRHLEDGPIEETELEEVCRQEIGSGLNEKMVALGIRRPSELAPVIARVGDLYRRFRTLGVEGFEGAEVRLLHEPSAGVELVGIVDAAFRLGELVLVDWKTRGLGDPAAQLGFYALLWALERGEIPDRVEAVSVETGEREEITVEEGRLADLAVEVSAMISRLREARAAGRPLDPRAGPWCRYCPVRVGCPEGNSVIELLEGRATIARS